MDDKRPKIGEKLVLKSDQLSKLFEVLKAEGYTIVGPTVKDDSIVLNEISGCEDLPTGWTDVQEAATYRLKKSKNGSYFNFNVGPQSWKRYLYPPKLRLSKVKRRKTGFDLIGEEYDVPKLALLGVRACELSAILIQDKIFAQGEYVDTYYRKQRENSLIIAVNCTKAGGTCFCVSMKTGPRAGNGYDIALTELTDAKEHVFLVEVGSKLGAGIVASLTLDKASETETKCAEEAVGKAATQMGRSVDPSRMPEILYRNLDNPRWDKVGHRCLNCANCTLVCPTCFCSTIEDFTDLGGEHAERVRRWDSCFTMDFSYIHGGSVRPSGKARYRQWLSHKMVGWIEQFGTSGCVGCGRCITWCPVGIDITEETKALLDSDAALNRPPETMEAPHADA